MLRIAMLSFAHVHANGYAAQITKHSEAEIVCVWDDMDSRGQAAADTLNLPYDNNLERVLGREDVDAVVVNTTTNTHRDVLIAAARAGKHIFTEKALTVTLADAEEVSSEIKASGVKFMISLPSRTMSQTLYARQVLDEGWLGDLTMMRARVAHSAALGKWFKGGTLWFGDAEQAGGGSLFDLGCHTVDMMRWFMGQPRSVVARVQNFSGAYNIDDQAAAVVEFSSGALGILDVSWVQHSGPNYIEIYGTKGFLGWETRTGLMEIQGTDHIDGTQLSGALQVSPRSLPKALPMPMEQWIAAILHDEEMTISIDDGRNLNELLEGIYVSAREDRTYRF